MAQNKITREMKYRMPRKKKKERKTKGIVHGCGWEHQIKSAPYKQTYNDFTLDDLTDFMKELEKEYEDRTPNYKRDQEYLNLISPYLHMTEEEMQKSIPDGMYELSGNELIAWTGKGGLIMSILAMQKEIKQLAR